MKRIKLTQGQYALVDDEDYDFLMQWKWFAGWNIYTNSYYARRNEGKKPNRSAVMMHRVIMNTPEHLKCDHKNHDTLNNQKYNLRNSTYSQNNSNSKVRKDNRLGERGIRMNGKKFEVRISKDKKTVFDRMFDTLEEAISVRNEMVTKIHGEFAYKGESL